MTFIFNLAVLTVIAVSAAAQNYTANSSIEDYSALWQRQLQNDIYVSELKIGSVDAQGTGSIKVLGVQQQVALKEIQIAEQSLVPMQALSSIHKYCIRKYRPLLVSWDTAQKQYAACLGAAQLRVNTLTSSAKNYLNAAKTTANVKFPNSIATCHTSYANNQTKLEECVLSSVDSHSKSVQDSLNTVDRNLDTSLCTLIELSRDAIQCSFIIERNSLEAIGKVLGLIDNCINETEIAFSCANVTSTYQYVSGMKALPSGE